MKKIYSDEEINNLISDVEENYMLKAPPNLKNDILDKIKKDEIKITLEDGYLTVSAEKAEKAKVAAEKKAKKIARDKQMREAKAKAKAERIAKE